MWNVTAIFQLHELAKMRTNSRNLASSLLLKALGCINQNYPELVSAEGDAWCDEWMSVCSARSSGAEPNRVEGTKWMFRTDCEFDSPDRVRPVGTSIPPQEAWPRWLAILNYQIVVVSGVALMLSGFRTNFITYSSVNRKFSWGRGQIRENFVDKVVVDLHNLDQTLTQLARQYSKILLFPLALRDTLPSPPYAGAIFLTYEFFFLLILNSAPSYIETLYASVKSPKNLVKQKYLHYRDFKVLEKVKKIEEKVDNKLEFGVNCLYRLVDESQKKSHSTCC